MSLSLFDRQGVFCLHPSHRAAMRRIGLMLLLLALGQLLAWLLPTPPGSTGIAAYLPLHVLFETFSIVIAMLVFAVGWNSHSRNLSGNLVLLACVFFVVGWLDLLHTLSYIGMPEFITPNDSEKHLNFWLVARVLATGGLFVIAIRTWRPFASDLTRYLLLSGLLSVAVLVYWLVLYHQNILPHTFIPGQGLTPLKVDLEYLFIAVNLVTAALFWKKMREPQTFNAALLFGAVCIMAMSEFFFTLYTTMTGLYNVLGHVYKVIAYLFIYRAIVVEGVEAPYQKLHEVQQSLALAIRASNTGLWDWDIRGDKTYFSPEWKAQLGYQDDELPNEFSIWESLLHPEDRKSALARVRDFLSSDHAAYESEFRLRHRDGSYRWILARGEKQCDANGKPIRLLGSHIDVSERKQAEQNIQLLVNYDALTGLPNRILLNDRAGRLISAAQRDRTRVALLFLDLDRFKNVNDTLGHRMGDKLLIEVGKRLLAAVRDKDTAARIGGDEFVLMLADAEINGVAHVASKLLASISQPYQIDQHELVVTPSIGIAIYPDDGADFEALYRSADIAMYRAKHNGRNNFCFFTPQMQEISTRRLQLENALRHALERDQLSLHYQPQLAIADGRVVGAEALLRWQHPEFGMVSPGEFIPIAETSGQIIKIGAWVLRTAAQQLRAWLDDGMPVMTVAVNLSAVQFRHSDLPGMVTHILEEFHLPPQCLELELTEGVAMDDPLAAIAVMDDLHACGVRMSIDDFGTGYSSFSYLKKFKVYKLKIDQSFVRDICHDTDDSTIVTAIIQMARSLGLQTIAEGVETEAQLAFLREQGCAEVQGYYFSKPLPANQFEAFVRG